MRKNWSVKDDEYLRNNYSLSSKEELTQHLKRSWMSINTRASKLKIKKININIRGKEFKIWSIDEDNYLRIHYPNFDKEKIIFQLKRSWSSIQNRAFLLKIKRVSKKAQIINLINGTNESFYWLGFLIADGHFSKTNHIQINLNEKDLGHLNKFAKFIEYENELIKPNISVSFIEIKNEIYDLLKTHNDKTHNPCCLSKLSGDSFFSFIIGFIDGDGCIDTKGYLTIKCHNSWLDNLNIMISELSNNNFNLGRVDSAGLAIVQLKKIKIMQETKKKAIRLGLPFLDRKWGRVDLKKEIKIDKINRIKNECFNYFEQNILPKEIIKKTNLSRSFIYKQFIEYNSIKEKDLKREMDREQN